MTSWKPKQLPALFSLAALLIVACNNNNETPDEPQAATTTTVSVPATFNADSAYAWVDKQVSFGPRVPGTAAQKNCARFLQTQLASFTDTVYVQNATVQAGNGKSLPCINLIGVIRPQATKRILLFAHWDSRPWADMDTVNKDKPIDAADDGASGVAVLLEIARQLKAYPLPNHVGIDIFFTDVEDYGKTEWGEDSYCLGTQYWARQPHVPGYKAQHGILLDMVGAKNAIFPMEATSAQYAPDLQNKVWRAAATAGYSSYFPFGVSQVGVTDDHKYVNELIGIPSIDIIHLDAHSGKTFPAHWHTHQDNMSIIDKATLKAVGQTLLQVLYELGAENDPV